MVEQVKVVSILMIVYGALLALVGLFVAALGPFFYAMEASAARKRDETFLTAMVIVFLVIGLLVLTIGILHIIAGVRTLKFRGRLLALVALFGNVPLVFTGYCSLFAIGMGVFGLIVFFNDEVARAFEMASTGVPPEDILAEFQPRRRRRRRRYADDDDYNDDRDADRRKPPSSEPFDDPDGGQFRSR